MPRASRTGPSFHRAAKQEEEVAEARGSLCPSLWPQSRSSRGQRPAWQGWFFCQTPQGADVSLMEEFLLFLLGCCFLAGLV